MRDAEIRMRDEGCIYSTSNEGNKSAFKRRFRKR
jgi:hypothetical protein